MSDNNVTSLLKKFQKAGSSPFSGVGVTIPDPERLSTGLFALDLATGGGLPEGRITQLYGSESSMKTSIALKCIATAQKKWPDRKCVFIDVEGHFSTDWATLLGVDCSKLVYIQPENSEAVVDMMEGLLHAEDIGLIVLDSIAAMVGQHELASDSEKAIVGGSSMVVGKMYRKITHAQNSWSGKEFKPTVILINQIRIKIGVMYGDPETVPGGQSFKFGCSMNIRLYGKDEFVKDVSQLKPAYKKISVIIKKWKVPVIAREAELLVGLMDAPDHNIKIGHAYDWNTMVQYMKHLNILVQGDKCWNLVDADIGEITPYPTQDALKSKVQIDPEFGADLKKKIIQKLLKTSSVIQPE